MMIQFILSAGLAACLFYVVSLGRSTPAMRLALFAVICTGLVLVWIPDLTNRAAALVGVGRGADLLMYLWIVLTLLLIVRLHLKMREQSELLTQIARRISLSEAGSAVAERQ